MGAGSDNIIYTIGHGTRSTTALGEVLLSAGVGQLVDVRRFPASRRYPHFAKEALERSMPELGIAYRWMGEELGGRRRPKKDGTRHPALRNAAFQGFADHMDTQRFRAALTDLEALARRGPPPAIMCAETLWWRCHRRLIADALTVDGYECVHLLDDKTRQPHRPSESMRTDEQNRPVYDVGVTQQLSLE